MKGIWKKNAGQFDLQCLVLVLTSQRARAGPKRPPKLGCGEKDLRLKGDVGKASPASS